MSCAEYMSTDDEEDESETEEIVEAPPPSQLINRIKTEPVSF